MRNAEKDFSKKILKNLAVKGIQVTAKTPIPGDGYFPMANSTTGYVLVLNNSHSYIRNHSEVCMIAGAEIMLERAADYDY